MVGGKLIDITEIEPGITRLWCVGTGSEKWDECAVHVESETEMPGLGDEIWWQSGTVLWDQDRKRLKKIANSYDPTREVA